MQRRRRESLCTRVRRGLQRRVRGARAYGLRSRRRSARDGGRRHPARAHRRTCLHSGVGAVRRRRERGRGWPPDRLADRRHSRARAFTPTHSCGDVRRAQSRGAEQPRKLRYVNERRGERERHYGRRALSLVRKSRLSWWRRPIASPRARQRNPVGGIGKCTDVRSSQCGDDRRTKGGARWLP